MTVIRFLSDARWGNGWGEFRQAGVVEDIDPTVATALIASGAATADSSDPTTPVQTLIHEGEDSPGDINPATGTQAAPDEQPGQGW